MGQRQSGITRSDRDPLKGAWQIAIDAQQGFFYDAGIAEARRREGEGASATDLEAVLLGVFVQELVVRIDPWTP